MIVTFQCDCVGSGALNPVQCFESHQPIRLSRPWLRCRIRTLAARLPDERQIQNESLALDSCVLHADNFHNIVCSPRGAHIFLSHSFFPVCFYLCKTLVA